MTINDLNIMRHEVLLISVIILTAILTIVKQGRRLRQIIIPGIFLLVTITGFLPSEEGFLLGGNWISSPLLIIMKNILNAGTLIILLQSSGCLKNEKNTDITGWFYSLIFVSLLGMYFMLSSGSLLTFYIGLELATVPVIVLYVLLTGKKKPRAKIIRFYSTSAIASLIVICGLSMIYGASGSMLFSDLIKMNMSSITHVFGLIVFLTGIVLKTGFISFNLLNTDKKERLQVNLLSFVSVILMSSLFFIVTILLYSVFPSLHLVWQKSILVVSIVTITGGNIMLLLQKNIKRFLVYSSVLQAGYMLVGIVGANRFGMEAMIYSIIVYILSALGVYGVVSAVTNSTGKEETDDFKGLYGTNPRLSLLMALGLLSLAGIPPLAGFFGRFFLFMAAAEQKFYFLVLVAALNMVFSLYCYLRFAGKMFVVAKESHVDAFRNGMAVRAGLIICTAGILFAGLAGFIFDYLRSMSFGIF
jgi:NADH-quinone oxidoreductase subunit N